MGSIKNEKILKAIAEYQEGLKQKENNQPNIARVHFVRALRLLENAYRETRGYERIVAIKLFEEISRKMRELEEIL